LVTACNNGITGEVTNEEVIELGSILILTGEGASWGQATKNGMELAVDEINLKGGINGKELIVHYEDDQSDAKKAMSAFRNLVNVKGVDIIIGTTWSHTGIPLIELAEENKVMMISPSLGKADFNEASDYLFNTWPHDYILSENLADYVYEKGHRKVAVIGSEQIWVEEQTDAFVNRFEELGGSIEVLLEPISTDRNMKSDALKIKNEEDIDAIVVTNILTPGMLTAKATRNLGVEQPMYAISIINSQIEASEGAYEGLEYLTFLSYTDEFEERYAELYGLENMDIGAPSGYDAVMMIAEAIEATGSEDTNVLQEYLNSIEVFEGASGTLISDGKGGFTKEHSVKKVVDGKVTDLE